MKLLEKIFLSVLFIFLSLQAMEERPSVKPMPALVPDVDNEAEQQREQASVLLELVDGNEIIFAIRIPLSFAQESSVLRNNLEFQEEEEGSELTVPLLASSVTIQQLEILKLFIDEYYLGSNLPEAFKILADSWYPDEYENLVQLRNISDFIGNEQLLKLCTDELIKYLQKMAEERKWEQFFNLLGFIESAEVQELLKQKVIDYQVISTLIKKLYFTEIPIEAPYYSFIVSSKIWRGAFFNFDQDNVKISIVDLKKQREINSFIISESSDLMSNLMPVIVVISPNGSSLYYTRSFTDDIRIFDIEDGKLLKQLHLEDGNIRSLCVSDDNNYIAVGCYDDLYVIDANLFEIRKKFKRRNVAKVEFSTDGKYIALLHEQTKIEILDWKKEITVEEIHEKSHPSNHIKSLKLSSDSRYLVYVLANGVVKIYDLVNKNEYASFTSQKQEQLYDASIAFWQNGNFFAVGFSDKIYPKYTPYPEHKVIQSDRSIQIWNIREKSIQKTVRVPYHNIYSVSVSPDQRKLAYVGQTFFGLDTSKGGEVFITDLDFDFYKKLSFESLLLLWYCATQVLEHKPIIIPEKYYDAFSELPKKVKKYFYEKNIAMEQPPAPLPFIYPYLKHSKAPRVEYLKEKRKKPEEKEGGKQKEKSSHKRFKWD